MPDTVLEWLEWTGVTRRELQEALQMPESTLRGRLHDDDSFTRGELRTIKRVFKFNLTI